MKVLILGGQAATAHPGPAPAAPGTRERGVLALGDGLGGWALVNLSPGVAHRLLQDGGPEGCHPRSVLLTDAQVDHVAGLLTLRDGGPIHLYATPAVFEDLSATLPVLPVLQHYCGVHWHMVPVAGDRRSAAFQVDALPTLEFTAMAVAAPVPPYSQHHGSPVVGDCIALAVRDRLTGQRVFCAPGLTQPDGLALDWMREAHCLLLDPPAPQALAALRALPARHKVLLGGCRGGTAPGPAEPGLAMAYDGMAIDP